MPTASRNERKKRRMKRTNSLLRRALQQEAIQRYKTHAMLMAVLAQKGGEVTITAGTMQQVSQNIQRLSYKVALVEDNPSEFIVSMVETAAPTTETTEEPSNHEPEAAV